MNSDKKYKYRIDELDDLGRFVRSMNAYASRKRAEAVCDKLNAEAYFESTGKEYIVCEA